jgi:hypothetical protein
VLGILFAASPSPALGGYASWQGNVSSDWANPDNWSAAVTGSYAIIFEGAPNLPAISTTDSVDTLDLATWTGSSTGSSLAVHSGANLTVGSGPTQVGNAGVGSITQDGGTVNVNGGINLANWGTAAGSSYSIGGNGVLNIGKAGTHAIGARGAATMNVSGSAVVTVDGYGGHTGGLLGLDIGGHLSGGTPLPDSTGTSVLNQTGGTVTLTADLPCLRLGVGVNTTGIYNLDGGTLNLATDVENRDGTGYLKINGGTLNFTGASIEVDNLEVGTRDGATGQFTLQAGQAILAHILTLGSSTSTGTLDLLGGTAKVDDLLFAGTTSKLQLDDGQSIEVLQSNYSLADGLADVTAGHVAAFASGSHVNISTVDIDGVAYTQLLGAAVPEPSAVMLLLAGMVAMTAYAWRKRK